MKVTVIGVAGGTGSGKSTLVKRLQEAFEGDDVVTLCHDYYYKAHPELTYEERTKLNYDHPQAFDTQMLVDHIKALKENVPIEHPVYSFVEHNRMTETVSVKPSKVIIVDGILIFENKELRDLMTSRYTSIRMPISALRGASCATSASADVRCSRSSRSTPRP